jgi:Glucose / Sorbosone dehydrogenase
MFPEWRGDFVVCGLSSTALVRLIVRGERAVGEERLLTDRGARIREVAQGPDGALYVLTDSNNGRLLGLIPPPDSEMCSYAKRETWRPPRRLAPPRADLLDCRTPAALQVDINPIDPGVHRDAL